jgi:cytoskeletal protein CcmA (bactofilin family)
VVAPVATSPSWTVKILKYTAWAPSCCFFMTTIGPSVAIRGDITSDEALTIHGRVKGNVVIRNAPLTISEVAQVDGNIKAERVLIGGTVLGTVLASQRLELRPTAHVEGSLSADSVVMADGARFDGLIDMARRTIAVKVAQFKERNAAS